MTKKNNKIVYDYQEALKLWRNGRSYDDLAEKYDCSRITIKRNVHEEAGILFNEYLSEHQINNEITRDGVPRKQEKMFE